MAFYDTKVHNIISKIYQWLFEYYCVLSFDFMNNCHIITWNHVMDKIGTDKALYLRRGTGSAAGSLSAYDPPEMNEEPDICIYYIWIY